MGYRTVAMIAAAIIAVMLAGSGWAIAVLPADALVPIHFGIDGRPDAWARPLVGLFLLPATAMVVLIACVLLARHAGGGLARSGTALRTVVLAVIGGLGAAHGIVIAAAFGREFNVTRAMVLLAGLLLLLVGNVMGKVRPNHWLGIRTPWTLADDRVWDRTHRLAGWIFVGAGAALVIAASIIPAGKLLGAIVLAVIAVAVIVPCAKSYLIWRDRQRV
jgi:uncharacterized membrane protein